MKKKNPDFTILEKVLRREGIPERVPFYEHFVDDEVIEKITGKPLTKLDTSKKDEKEKYLKIKIDFYFDMGYDYVPVEIPLNLPRDNILIYPDTAGLPKKHRDWQDENRGVIANDMDFEKYPWPDEKNLMNYYDFEFVSKNLPEGMKIIGGVAGGVFENLCWLMGLVPLSYTLYDNPELVLKITEKIGDLIYTADKNIINICGDKMLALRMGDDMGYKTSTMLPPQDLRKYIFPHQKKIVELAHKNNLPFILHSCGELKEIMNDLIDYVGIDAKHSFEDVILPVTEAKKIYGNKIAILGGVDVDKLSRANTEEIRKYTRNILEKCAPSGGYALGSGNTIANYVKIENYFAMLDECNKFNGN